MPSALSANSVPAFRLALAVLPAAAGWMAFWRAARVDALNQLLRQGACGNVEAMQRAPVLLGHCLDCWTAGATAAGAVWLGLMTLKLVAGGAAPARMAR